MDGSDEAQRRPRQKRKADSRDNEPLSKRLSLLNLDHRNGTRQYVPVPSTPTNSVSPTPNGVAVAAPSSLRHNHRSSIPGDSMQVDDAKHRVYVFNLDDELSSSESEREDGRVVFLSEIDKHIRANTRIPPVVPPNSDGELAGMQLVLYNSAPNSLTVPEDRDSVRKAIIESRARFREQQLDGRSAIPAAVGGSGSESGPSWGQYGDSMNVIMDAHLNVQANDDPDAMDLS